MQRVEVSPRVDVGARARDVVDPHEVEAPDEPAHARPAERAALRDDEPDGFPSWQEFVADTDPTNALSFPRIAYLAAESTNAPVVTWLASTGRAYQVHFSDAFPGGPWVTQQVSIGIGEWTDTNPPLPPWRVYRLAPLRP